MVIISCRCKFHPEVVGLEVLTSYNSYGAAEETQHSGRRDYVGQPINAVVVRALLTIGYPKVEAVVHCHFTLLVMGLCSAFRLWQAHSTLVPTAQTAVHANLSTALLGGEGTARKRCRQREENRDKIIVFIGQAYGIFHLAEFAVLTHVPIRRLSSALGSSQAVLQRFGLSP